MDRSLCAGAGGVAGAAIARDALTLRKGTYLALELKRALLFQPKR